MINRFSYYQPRNSDHLISLLVSIHQTKRNTIGRHQLPDTSTRGRSRYLKPMIGITKLDKPEKFDHPRYPRYQKKKLDKPLCWVQDTPGFTKNGERWTRRGGPNTDTLDVTVGHQVITTWYWMQGGPAVRWEQLGLVGTERCGSAKILNMKELLKIRAPRTYLHICPCHVGSGWLSISTRMGSWMLRWKKSILQQHLFFSGACRANVEHGISLRCGDPNYRGLQFNSILTLRLTNATGQWPMVIPTCHP